VFSQGTFREHSGNIQGTFREHSGNVQGTFREYSGNIQGKFREDSGNIQYYIMRALVCSSPNRPRFSQMTWDRINVKTGQILERYQKKATSRNKPETDRRNTGIRQSRD
jgi:hypothetical protein